MVTRKFKPFVRLTPEQLSAVKRRGWHGYRARNSDEWFNRFEISHEFYRIEGAKEKDGLTPGIDSRSSYEEAARIVDGRYTEWKRKYLSCGYAIMETFI